MNLQKDRDGPWVPLNIKKIYKKIDCGDCMRPTPVRCLGNHETSDLPCHKANPYNCGRKCGKKLACTHHTCEIECHEVKKMLN